MPGHALDDVVDLISQRPADITQATHQVCNHPFQVTSYLGKSMHAIAQIFYDLGLASGCPDQDGHNQDGKDYFLPGKFSHVFLLETSTLYAT